MGGRSGMLTQLHKIFFALLLMFLILVFSVLSIMISNTSTKIPNDQNVLAPRNLHHRRPHEPLLELVAVLVDLNHVIVLLSILRRGGADRLMHLGVKRLAKRFDLL